MNLGSVILDTGAALNLCGLLGEPNDHVTIRQPLAAEAVLVQILDWAMVRHEGDVAAAQFSVFDVTRFISRWLPTADVADLTLSFLGGLEVAQAATIASAVKFGLPIVTLANLAVPPGVTVVRL